MCICSEVTYKLYNDSGIDGRCENWISSGALLDDGRVLAVWCNVKRGKRLGRQRWAANILSGRFRFAAASGSVGLWQGATGSLLIDTG